MHQVNIPRSVCLLVVSLAFLLAGCESDEGVNPAFSDPPESYFLVEELTVIEDGDNTLADLDFFSYNDLGKLDGDGIFYDNQNRLIQSPWPNREVFAGVYYYKNGKADSIVTFGHPVYTLYFDLEYTGDSPSQIRIFRRENDASELTLIENMGITYVSENEMQIVTEDQVLTYLLDDGRSPFPYEYRLSHWWWPYSQNISMILTDRNVLKLTVTTDGEVTNEVEFSYEYDQYGFVSRMTRGNTSKYYKYSETPD